MLTKVGGSNVRWTRIQYLDDGELSLGRGVVYHRYIGGSCCDNSTPSTSLCSSKHCAAGNVADVVYGDLQRAGNDVVQIGDLVLQWGERSDAEPSLRTCRQEGVTPHSLLQLDRFTLIYAISLPVIMTSESGMVRADIW